MMVTLAANLDLSEGNDNEGQLDRDCLGIPQWSLGGVISMRSSIRVTISSPLLRNV
jgi:hypothetical protein